MGAVLRTVRRAVAGICVLAGGIALGSCGGSADKDGTLTSPVSGAARSNEEHKALAPLIVTPVEPAVAFKASSGHYLVSYELRLYNATPITLAPTRVSVSTPDGTVLRKLDAAQTREALALPSARTGGRLLTEGQQATLYLTLAFKQRSGIPERLVHRIVAESRKLPNGRVVSSPASVRCSGTSTCPCSARRCRPAAGTSPPTAAARRCATGAHCCRSATTYG